ncbi:MAG: hypothetical protein DLM59_05190 [Pseudonocardiales bacterium]|nr:MAG: hypothetical protein DLM59_05190 [Pseudonocardiales bacterium]
MAALRTAVEQGLPRLAMEVDVLVPYARGDLVSRVHDDGDVLAEAHTGEGTHLRARVTAALAADLAPFAIA